MPAERGKDAAERFAAAVDSGRSPLSAGSDADLARELAIVARLRSREGTLASHDEAMAMLRSGTDAHAPRADEKARAKQRLMAMLAERSTPEQPDAPGAGGRVVAFPAVTAADPTSPIPTVRDEPVAGEARVEALDDPYDDAFDDAQEEADGSSDTPLAAVTPLAGRSRRGRHALPAAMKREAMGRAGRSRLAGERPGIARRAGVVGSAALFVLVAFTGTGVFVSQDALPGQTLYPLKRAAEAASLAMTFDDAERAQRNLELAALRIGELERLVALGGSGIDPQVVRVAMSEFDLATNEGSRALLSGGGDDALHAWAATQSARLSALRPSLPDPALPATDTSLALLDGLIGKESLSSDSPRTGSGADRPDRITPQGPVQRNGAPGAGTDSSAHPADPSATPEEGLPGLQPDGTPLVTDPENPATATPQDPAATQDTQNPRVPLPLPGAPVTLPPLLPGMPPLTIG
ncbi:DUF5667 domain-containing protein [Pseudonocardia sp.]|uniref:DUF5667 domain-containing protein n=1 Tax=Pseudonocardia sp. TaxID=60912 RepID=UPI003D0CA9FB